MCLHVHEEQFVWHLSCVARAMHNSSVTYETLNECGVGIANIIVSAHAFCNIHEWNLLEVMCTSRAVHCPSGA